MSETITETEAPETEETETGTEETETETVETDPASILLSHENDTIRGLFEKAKAREEGVRELHSQIRKSSPPSQKEIDEAIAESEDAEIVAARTKIEKAQEALRKAQEAARALVSAQFSPVAPEELAKMREDFNTQSEQIKNLLRLAAGTAEVFEYDDAKEAIATYQKSLPSLRGVTSGPGTTTTATGPGSGVPRVKVSRIVTYNAETGNQLRDFTGDKGKMAYVATANKLSTEELVNAWLAAAEVEKWQDISDVVPFVIGNVRYEIHPKSE